MMTTATATAARRAFGYARVSSQAQATENNVSLTLQQGEIASYCEARGMTLAYTYVDVASGRRDDRSAYQDMIAALGRGEAEAVVVLFLDRFGRRPPETLQRIWRLQEIGVTVESCREDLSEEIMLLIRSWTAGQESRRTGERVRDALRRVSEQGTHVGPRPYGLRKRPVIEGDEVRAQWEIDPTEGPVVRRMFEMIVRENKSPGSIADTLNAEGVRTRHGRPWQRATIRGILTNPALRGALAYGTKQKKHSPVRPPTIVEGAYPPILSPEEWDDLQARLVIRQTISRGRVHTSAYMLSGIAKCATCGGPLNGKESRRGQRSYFCSRHAKAVVMCPSPNYHPAAKLEAAILDHLAAYADPDAARALLEADDVDRRQIAAADLKGVRRKLARVKASFDKLVNMAGRGILSDEEFKDAADPIRAERATLEGQERDLLAAAEAQDESAAAARRIPELVASFQEAFDRLTVQEKKARLQTIIERATVYPDRRIVIDFRT